MRLASTIQVYGGGQGSGCNPAVGKCGRYVHGVQDLSDAKKVLHTGFKHVSTGEQAHFGEGIYLSPIDDKKASAYKYPHIVHVDVELKKPFIVSHEDKFNKKFESLARKSGFKIAADLAKDWTNDVLESRNAEAITNVLKALGYDGIIIKKSWEGPQTVVFNPKALKVKGYSKNGRYES